MRHLIFGAALAALAAPAAAGTRCAERSVAVETLSEKYGEARQMIATSSGGIVEIFGNPETGTWSMIITLPDGKTCLLVYGENFEITPAPTGEAL